MTQRLPARNAAPGSCRCPRPEVDAQLSDPAAALVIVATFNTLAQASLLSTRLEAAGIEPVSRRNIRPARFHLLLDV